MPPCLPKDLTCVDLAAHPHLLQQNCNPSLPYRPFDGQVGAVVSNGEYFVTSPNMTTVLQPPLGTRAVRLRSDCRYGDDDPLLWPQLYHQTPCHYGAIRRKPEDREDPTRILWRNLTDTDFVPVVSGLLDGLGHPHSDLIKGLNDIRKSIIERFEKYQGTTKEEDVNKLSQILSRSLEHSQQRFEGLAMPRARLQFALAEYQRTMLELQAVVDYMVVYHPRMNGYAPRATEVAKTMGTFTSSLLVAQQFFDAGLPVWLIREFKDLPGVRIEQVVEPRQPLHYISLEDASPPHPIIFLGPGSSDEKFYAIANLVRTFLKTTNALEPPPPDPSSIRRSTSLVSSQSSSRIVELQHQPPRLSSSSRSVPKNSQLQKAQVSTRSTHPYTRTNEPKKQSKQDPFAFLSSPGYPTIPDVWSKALVTPISESSSSSRRRGYVLPEPALFVRVSTEDKRASYLFTYLRFRNDLLYRLTLDTLSPEPNYVWRTLLVFADTNHSDPENPDKARGASNRDQVRTLLEGCLSAGGVQPVTEFTTPEFVDWKGVRVQQSLTVDNTLSHQILWELCELNFRHDLIDLNHHLRAWQNKEKWDLIKESAILDCFTSPSLQCVDHSKANTGLAAPTQQSRLSFFVSLAKVLYNWDGRPDIVMRGGARGIDEMNSEERSEFEYQCARFFVEKFHYEFGRLPCVPHNLS